MSGVLAEASPVIEEFFHGGAVSGEGVSVYLDVGPVSIRLDIAQADEVSKALESVIRQMRARGAGEVD